MKSPTFLAVAESATVVASFPGWAHACSAAARMRRREPGTAAAGLAGIRPGPPQAAKRALLLTVMLWGFGARPAPAQVTLQSILGFEAWALSNDGRVLAGSWQNQPTFWTAETGLVSYPWSGPANALSGDGTTLGGSVLTPIRWRRGGTFEILPSPRPGNWGSVSGLSGDGSIAVGFTLDEDYHVIASLWSATGEVTLLGVLPGATQDRSSAAAVSEDGTRVVGGSASSDGTRAFRWTAGTGMQALPRFPGDFPAADWAAAISDDNRTIVGTASDAAGYHAVKWTEEGGLSPLGALTASQALAVSADGRRIVGVYLLENAEARGFLWDPLLGSVDLQEYLLSLPDPPAGLADWQLWPEALSADGSTIVGRGIDPSGQRGTWIIQLASVPEPAGLSTGALLVLAGLCSLRLAARRRHSGTRLQDRGPSTAA